MTYRRYRKAITRGFVAMVMAVASTSALADFSEAFKNYEAGRYEQARVEFVALAELGDGASQHNLGAMFLQGQGGQKDIGVGVGWLMAAVDNGYAGIPDSQLKAMQAKLTAEQSLAAKSIVERYGKQAISARLLPQRGGSCKPATIPKVIQMPTAEYPVAMRADGFDGIVIVAVTIGIDGLVRDPEVVMSVPDKLFEFSSVAAVMRSRFEPAKRDGVAIEYRDSMKFDFSLQGGGALWNFKAVKSVRAAAEQNQPGAQYLVGALGMLDRSMSIPRDTAYELIVRAAQGGHIRAQRWVGRDLGEFGSCIEVDKSNLWLQQAARGGESSAQVTLARRMLEAAPPPEKLAEVKSLIEAAARSEDPYAVKHAAALLATSTTSELRNGPLARQAAGKLSGTWAKYDPQAVEVSAAAYAATGEFSKAVARQTEAIKMATSLHWNTQRMEERLAAYRAKSAWTGEMFSLPAATDLPPPSGKLPEGLCGGSDTKPCDSSPHEPPAPTTPIGTRIPREP
jgi:uncharacterized protein